MLGPITFIPRDPLIALVLTAGFVLGMLVYEAARGRRAFSTLTWWNAALYLVVGLFVPRAPHDEPRGPRRAWRSVLVGPAALLGYAFALLAVRQALAAAAPALDVVNQGMRLAAISVVLHAVYFLVPLPTLDAGRALIAAGPPRAAALLARLKRVEGPLPYLLWLALWFSGLLALVLAPIWSALQTVLSWLPI